MVIDVCLQSLKMTTDQSSDLKHFLDKVSSAKHNYCGTLDQNGFRSGNGCEKWFKQDGNQKYTGQFLYNNLHNKGVYLIDKQGDQTYMDGLFYANKLEGYGKVVYANNTVFEGLYKQHVRYGPGVLTYPDGSQDVGIWDGFSLRRLSVVVGDDFVPRLGKTSLGKARLLQFRTMVPVCIKNRDLAKEILTELGASDDIVAQSDNLYNLNVRNPDSLFFDKRKNFLTGDECVIDVILSKEEFEEEVREYIHVEEEFEELENIEMEEISKSKSDCMCFQTNIDRFGHMCLQLQEVEIKLEKLTSKKQNVEEELRLCKYCCDHIVILKEKLVPSTKPTLKQQLSTGLVSQEEEALEQTSSLNKKMLSFLSSETDTEVQHNYLTRSEIELRNYLYLTDSSVTEEGNYFVIHAEDSHYHQRLSGATLPFSFWDSTFSQPALSPDRYLQFKEYQNLSELEDEESDVTLLSARLYKCYCTDKLLENADILKKTLATLIQEEMFYNTIRLNLKNHLDIEFQRLNLLSQEKTRFVKKVVVSDLLAWNNEEIWITILQHCFRHRLSENNVTFNVSDLLTGHRHYFQKAGIYESTCKQFLEGCGEGHEKDIFNYIKTFNINPDVCDARGNTGLMLAALREKNNCIAMLVNCGAKMDILNDEGLTPLSISLLKYISFKLKVSDWEKAFLDDELVSNGIAKTRQWRPTESVMSVYNVPVDADKVEVEQKSSKAESKDLEEAEMKLQQESSWFDSKTFVSVTDLKKEQEYIFNTDYIRVVHKKAKHKKKEKKKKKGKKKKGKKFLTHKYDKKRKHKKHKEASKKSKGTSKSKKSKGKDKSKKSKKSRKKKEKKPKKTKKGKEKAPVNTEKYEQKLESIKKTIFTLLHYGSDPNIGQVPLKPIFLSVFSDDSNILLCLLQHSANPNEVTSENLTSLHLIASLKPSLEKVKMCEILLGFKADPNIKTSNSHWSKLRKELLGEEFDGELPEEGKSVLHLLCLREDFVDDLDNLFSWIAFMLVESGCRTDDYYMGHTPLSLAVLRGNIRLIETLLKTMKVNPYQLLEYGMGNVLTVLILNRFASILSDETKKEVASCLISNGLNPLTRIDEFENAIAFMENEEHLLKLKQMSKEHKVKKKKKKKKKKKGSSRTSKKSSKKTSKKTKKSKKSSKKHKRSKKSSKKSSKKHKRSKKSSKKSSKKTKKGHSKEKVESVQHFITKLTRNVLYTHLQGLAVKYLYILLKEALVADPLTVVLAKFVTPREALNILQVLFQNGLIKYDQFNPLMVNDVVQFVRIQQHIEHSQEDLNKIQEIIDTMSWKPVKKNLKHLYLPQPEVDTDEDKYKVCFQCLKSQEKRLLRCPSCELVYFCSQECNTVNNKTCHLHTCNVPFYNPVSEIVKDEAQPSRLKVLLEMAEKMGKEKAAWLQYLELHDKVKMLKFLPSSIKHKLEKLHQSFKEVEKEREDFAVKNSFWDYRNILRQSDPQSVLKDVIFEKIPEQAITQIYKSYSNVLKDTSDVSKVFHTHSTAVLDNKITSPYPSSSRSKSQHLLRNTPQSFYTPTSTTVIFSPKHRRLSQYLSRKMTTSTVRLQESVKKQDERKNKSTASLRMAKDDLLSELYKNDDLAWVDKKHLDKSYYMQLLSKIFADFNLPLLLLPYACYKDGQVYYSMTGNMSYFGSSFHKLHFPD